MKTLLPNKDFSLSNNELYFLSNEPLNVGDWVMHGNIAAKNHYILQIDEENVIRENDGRDLHNKIHTIPHVGGFKITHSTASLQGVKQLDRSLFVKGEDVEELARENCPENYIDASYEDCFKYGFERGYNANKKEWTDQEFKFAIHKAVQLGKQGIGAIDAVKTIKKVLQPLSLPASITLNGEEIIINW